MNITTRVVVYTKDVSNITGLGPRAERKLLSSIRKQLNKPIILLPTQTLYVCMPARVCCDVVNIN